MARQRIIVPFWLVELIGVGLVTFGTALWSFAAALVVLGVVLIVAVEVRA